MRSIKKWGITLFKFFHRGRLQIMKKKFDTIQMVREIRDNLHKKTKRMTTQERISFYHEQAKKFYTEFGIKEPAVKIR